MISSQFYKLKLSQNFKIHSVVHVKLLESYRKEQNREKNVFFSVDIVTQQEKDEEWKVKDIVKSRKRRKKIQHYV